jgi:hypothetical protein
MGQEAQSSVRWPDAARPTRQPVVVGPRVARAKALRARRRRKAAVDGPNWPDQQSTDACEVGGAPRHRVRQRFVADGRETALTRPPPACSHAHLTAPVIASLACRQAPETRGWRRLADAGRTRRVGAIGRVACGHPSQTAPQPWLQALWGLPPAAPAAFGCARADRLEVSQRPSDEPRPLVCGAAGTTPWGQDGRAPRPAAPGRPARIDDEDDGPGPGTLVLRCEPWAGPRAELVTDRRPAVDAAEALPPLVEVRSPRAATRVRVQDTRHPPQRAARDAACPPAAARRRLARLAVHETPQPGRGRTRAAIARGGVRRQGLDRRLPDGSPVTGAVAAWPRDRHTGPGTVAGQCTTAKPECHSNDVSASSPRQKWWTDH